MVDAVGRTAVVLVVDAFAAKLELVARVPGLGTFVSPITSPAVLSVMTVDIKVGWVGPISAVGISVMGVWPSGERGFKVLCSVTSTPSWPGTSIPQDSGSWVSPRSILCSTPSSCPGVVLDLCGPAGGAGSVGLTPEAPSVRSGSFGQFWSMFLTSTSAGLSLGEPDSEWPLRPERVS